MSSLPERSHAAETPRHSYDDLFGDAPETVAPSEPVPPDPLAYDDPVVAEPYLPPAARRAEQDEDGSHEHVREVAEAVPVRAARPVDTGRLYHSAGADAGDTGAIPAISASADAAPSPPSGSTARPVAQPEPDPVSPPARPAGAAPVTFAPGEAPPSVDASPAQQAKDRGTAGSAPDTVAAERGLTYLGAIVVIGAPTLLVGLAQAIIWNRIGWLTGLVLVLTTAYTALTLRRSDFAAAIVVPPLAFLVTTLLAGQLTLLPGQSLLVREAFMIVQTLAEAAPWVLGAAAVGAGIVLYRRHRLRTPTT